MHLRSEKLARLFQKEVSLIIARDLTNADIGFVTVTAVQFNRDTSKATIYVSILGEEKSKEKSINALNKAKGAVRHFLAERVVLRYMPEIEFKEDVQYDQIEKTLSIMKQLEDEKNKSEK